jgi:hypothetical protein
VAGVMRSGVIGAGAAVGDDLLRRALSGEVLGDPLRLPPLRDDWDPWRASH